jgi:ABC-type transporter Mla subunit MlaD
MTSAGDTFDELGDRSSPLAQLLVELPKTLRDVPPTFATLRRTVDHVDPTLEALRPTARALPRGLAALDRMTPDLRAGMTNLDTAMRPLHRLMHSSGPVARELDTALTRLEPQVRRADVMNQRAKPCLNALSAYLAEWLSVYKLYDDSTVLTHGQANYSSGSAGGTPDPALSTPKSCTGTPVP